MSTEFNYLALSWGVSRGRDTYGYNIARLDSHNSGKRYRCSGGGYDMTGTVLGMYLESEHQDRLQLLKKISNNGEKPKIEDCGYSVKGWTRRPDLYGLTFDPKGKAHIDGACGINSVERIAEAIGLNIKHDYSERRRRTIGFFVS